MPNEACGIERNVDVDVAKAQQTAFVCVANVQRTAECYPFGIGTSKKNTFTMLGVRLTRQMPNKSLLAFVRVHLSPAPACLLCIRVQMWTYLYSE